MLKKKSLYSEETKSNEIRALREIYQNNMRSLMGEVADYKNLYEGISGDKDNLICNLNAAWDEREVYRSRAEKAEYERNNYLRRAEKAERTLVERGIPLEDM